MTAEGSAGSRSIPMPPGSMYIIVHEPVAVPVARHVGEPGLLRGVPGVAAHDVRPRLGQEAPGTGEGARREPDVRPVVEIVAHDREVPGRRRVRVVVPVRTDALVRIAELLASSISMPPSF